MPRSWPSAVTRLSGPGSAAATPCSTDSTRTSSGRSATTSSRCPPTAPSATSAWAGPATPRHSRPRAPRSSTLVPSGRHGCATSRWTRTIVSACHPWSPTSSSMARRASGGPAGLTLPRSCRGPCTSHTATTGSCAISSGRCSDTWTRCAPGSDLTVSSRHRACSSETGSTRMLPSRDPGKPRPTRSTSPTPSSSSAPASPRTRRTLCGEGAWAADARALATRVRDTTWKRWADHAVTTQTGCAVALCLGIAPESEREAVAEALAALVRESDGRVRTGFLGTPLVLPALADAGRWEEAYLMLLREDVPSWLYQVRQGATTVWERWDAIRPDGSIHPGTMSTPPEMAERPEGDEPHMLSFNHYAYGAVIDWVYRHVAGLAPDRSPAGVSARGHGAATGRRHRPGQRRDREPVRAHRRSVAGRRSAPLQRRSRAAIRDHRHVPSAGD